MKEIILQKSNFRCRENIYICRLLRRLRRLAVEYVKNNTLLGYSRDTDESSPFGPLTQRLVSALIEENIMTPLDDATMAEAG